MLDRQRRDVAALAVRERRARARTAAAAARVARARGRFLANPVNLLLPFTAGALGAALALYRRPPRRRGARRREGVAWTSLLKTATTLWGLSLPLREAIREARAENATAAARDASVRPSAPSPPTPQPAPPA